MASLLRTNPRTGQTYQARPNRVQRGLFDNGSNTVGSSSNAPTDNQDPRSIDQGGGTVAVPPEDISPFFPQFTPVGFNPVDFPSIKAAPYDFTDPQAFAKQFADFNRSQIKTNFGQSQDMALQALQTELKGLQAFAPAAGALAREQTSIDNQFNQMMRLSQIQGVLPNARGDLNAQRQRALSYARGELPDSITDRALELGIRSRAADQSGFSGVGARSLQAEKTSDLMSADQRLQISQYGEGLLGQNLQTSANLLLSPTEYSQVGSQIRPTPEVGAGRLTYQGLGALNEATLLSPGNALEATIQQKQFGTNLEQRTREFNATGTFNASTFNSQGQLQADEFNSTGQFTQGLGFFNYQNQLAGQNQAASQANLNAALGLGLQGVQNDAAGGQFQAAQPTPLNTIAQGIGAIGGALNTASQVLSNTGTVGGGGSSGSMGGTGVSTEPQQTSLSEPIKQTDFQLSPSAPSTVGARGADAAIPYTTKFASGVPTPAGYQAVGGNGDGTYSAVNLKDYQNEVDRFAKNASIQPGSIKVENAAMADKAVTNSAGLSYLPLGGFRPIALSGNGSTVYSLPQAADSANYLKGAANVDNLALVAAQLGVSSPSIESNLARFADDVSDPSFHQTLDKLALSSGGPAVAQAISNRLLGKSPDLKTDAGQQFAFASQRIGELWPNLSPEQKSMALASLTSSALQLKTGKNLAQENVPGTERSVAGPLKAGDAMSLTMQGVNGFSLARNWNQLSAISTIATDAKGTRQIARVSDYAQLLGYGVQGSSVPVQPDYLEKVGAISVPSLGIGMVALPRPNLVPPNYKVVSQTPDGKTLAMPANLTHTSVMNEGNPNPLGYKMAQIVSRGQHPAQRLWAAAPGGRLSRGATGGSAIVSGLNTMVKANPAVFSSVAANSLFGNTING